MAYKICPECGGKVAQTRTVCIHCNYDFESLFRYCKECGCRVNENIDECPECGSYELGEIIHTEENLVEECKEVVEDKNDVNGLKPFQPFDFKDVIAKETLIIEVEPVFTMIEVFLVNTGLYVILRSKEIKYKNFDVYCGYDLKYCSSQQTYRKQCNSLDYVFIDKKIFNSASENAMIKLDFGANLPSFLYEINKNLLNLVNW